MNEIKAAAEKLKSFFSKFGKDYVLTEEDVAGIDALIDIILASTQEKKVSFWDK